MSGYQGTLQNLSPHPVTNVNTFSKCLSVDINSILEESDDWSCIFLKVVRLIVNIFGKQMFVSFKQ